MGILMIFFIVGIARVAYSDGSCWWTGCQSKDWAVRGCESYNMTQADISDCDNGNKYYCCPRTANVQTEETPASSTPTDCWWTGCQSKDWAVRGCESYNRTQLDIRDCENGNEFYCCQTVEKVVTPIPPPPDTPSAPRDCWWTGCQSKDWAVRGCESYNRTQLDIRDCENGNEFYCCVPTKDDKPVVDDDVECWWSSCQPSNWTARGCPKDMKMIATQDCGENEGDMFQCCGKKEIFQEPNLDFITGTSFTDYVKYLLFKSKNFTLEPDDVPCLSLDTDKQMLFQIGNNQGIYICDLCPYFPQQRLVNVYFNNVPFVVEPNLLFGECFGYCFDRNECVAFSYDHVERLCYAFNNTMGTFGTEEKWTTVLMTQPVGILDSWSYSRHTSFTGYELQTSQESSFANCLKKCDSTKECNYASYSIPTSTCTLFSSLEKILYIDFIYGHISGVKISTTPVGSDVSSRFTETGGDSFISDQKGEQHDKCSASRNATHSSFYAKECLVAATAGCDQNTGCKSCYYPENTEDYVNLPICPDSEFFLLDEVKKKIQDTMKHCLGNPTCIGVGYNAQNEEAREFTFKNFAKREFTHKFLLRYPTATSDDQMLMTKYDFLFSYDIEKLSNSAKNFEETTGKSLQECLKQFSSNNANIRMSYWNNKCKISSEEVKFIYKDGADIVTAFKKPTITSPLLNYARTPGFSIPQDKAKQTFDRCTNCEVECAQKCFKEFESWCSHFTIHSEQNKKTCFFFDFFDDGVASKVQLQKKENGQTFTKLSDLDFSLESLNNLNPFQTSDIYNCFQPDTKSDQTQTSLTPFPMGSNDDTTVGMRRKRGFFDFFKKAAKAVGKFITNTVKDIVKPVVDTAKGVVNSIKNVVKGDFKAAKESFMNIPVVKDVKNAVELGKAVVTGDWDTAKKKGADLLQSSTLNIATSLIPVGGKIIGTGLKTIGKQIGKQTAKIGKAAKGKVGKGGGKNKQTKKDKPKNDKEKEIEQKRNHCKRRQKRATAPAKRKGPGDCDDDDDNDREANLCPKVINDKAIRSTMSKCTNRRVNAHCEFECEPGYDEPNRDVKCVKKGKQRPFWEPRPDCDVVHCAKSIHPLIPLHTPHIKTFGSVEFGKSLTAYVVLYEKWRKLPVWSIALHQSDQFMSSDYNNLKNLKRAGPFKQFPCPELVGYQANDDDYYKSGWDKGHLTPANVARWSEKAKLSSNLYINAAPQDPYTNQVPWSHMEAIVQCFSKTHRSLVATGLCDDSIGKTPTGLDVPSCFWKMVCYKDENQKEQVVTFIGKNTHVKTPVEKQNRRKEIYTPGSQLEVKAILRKKLKYIQSPWIVSAKEINKGRPIQVGTDATVWFPVNPFDCENANDLPIAEQDAWNEAFLKLQTSNLNLGKRKRKNSSSSGGGGKKPRPKRAAKNKITRGCDNISELRNMIALLDFESDGDELVDDDTDNGKKDSDVGRELIGLQNCNKRMIGYYTSWGDKEIEQRQLRRLTHVIYAFLEMKADGSVEVGSPDRKNSADINKEINKARERLVNLMDLAALNPHIKVMFAVGGWENSQYFSSVAADPQKRITFTASVIKLIQRYGFDGVDIDWEYPVTGGANEGIAQDKQNYVTLMKEMRNVLDNLAADSGRKDKFLLSFAGAAGQWTLDPGFDLPELFKYVDFANIMTYDYFGAWASKWGAYTGPPSPLHFGMPTGFSGKTNMDWTVKHYTCKTGQPHKINIGVPFYGRYWKNVGAPVDGKDGMWRKATAVNGKFEGGYVPWYKIDSEFLKSGGFEKNFHEKSKTPYAWNPGTKTFLGYENKESLKFKADYAVKKNVGGLMIWAVELDDDDLTLLGTISSASLCDKTNPKEINFKCVPIDEKRWWTPEDGEDKAGLCGKSAPLYKGYYPVCDPDDPGYSCCGSAGYCGFGDKYCSCPTCKNYGENPDKILDKPVKPSIPVTWYLLNDPDGKRGRCGRKIPKINGVFPTCNPDDENAYCCSNGGYCGNSKDHCKCNGCIDFKANPNYKFGPKKWWDMSDGDLAGKCGPNAPKVDGIYEAECEPNTKFSCCSPNGYCGSGPEYCDCPKCKKFT